MTSYQEFEIKIDALDHLGDKNFFTQAFMIEQELNSISEKETISANELDELFKILRNKFSDRQTDSSGDSIISDIAIRPLRVLFLIFRRFLSTFNPSGRLSRKGYNQRFLIGIACFAIVQNLQLAIPAALIFIWWQIAMIKRLHDLGITGWRILITPFTFDYIWLFPFYKGESVANKWGPNPIRKFKLFKNY